jgi:alkylation response protein AidB-like acyl-CoA dehydrogenase
MDFNFSDEQEQLRDAVRKWVDKGYDFERRKQIVAEGGFSRAAFNELVELGLGGLYIPEELGGLGMGPVEGMVVMEELGRGIVLEPLAHTLDCWRCFVPLRNNCPADRMVRKGRWW